MHSLVSDAIFSSLKLVISQKKSTRKHYLALIALHKNFLNNIFSLHMSDILNASSMVIRSLNDDNWCLSLFT